MFAGRSNSAALLKYSATLRMFSPTPSTVIVHAFSGLSDTLFAVPWFQVGELPRQDIMFYFATFKVQVVPAVQRFFSTIN
jgi:hypothetical protein